MEEEQNVPYWTDRLEAHNPQSWKYERTNLTPLLSFHEPPEGQSTSTASTMLPIAAIKKWGFGTSEMEGLVDYEHRGCGVGLVIPSSRTIQANKWGQKGKI